MPSNIGKFMVRIVKQPWNYPMTFATRNAQLEKNTWHKLQFLPIYNKVVGAIDWVIMFDCTMMGLAIMDLLDFGRIAIHCMIPNGIQESKRYNHERKKTEKIVNCEIH